MSRVDEIRKRSEAIIRWKWDANAHGDFHAAAPEDISYLLGRVEKLEGLLNEVADDSPCRLDHHGFCQAHGFTESPCPVSEARTLLADESKENAQ